MRIAVTGASGLIGSALVPHLRAAGHDVIRLVRRPSPSADEVSWDPDSGWVTPDALSAVDVVVHLAGAGVGDHRWTAKYKREILDSRVLGTRTIARAMASAQPSPRVLVSASAIGWYGDTGGALVDESAPAGEGFLADVVGQWEAAAGAAVDAGIRVCHPRTGLVVARHGGAWSRMFPLFRLGLGGKLGDGHQFWSWISLRDQVRALTFLIEQPITGPVNLTAPHPASNTEITTVIGRVLGRPTVLPVPSMALKLALGEFSTEVLTSARVDCKVLRDNGFEFDDPTIEDAVRWALATGVRT